MKIISIFAAFSILLISCNQSNTKDQSADEQTLRNVMERMKTANVQVATCIESIDGGAYTYVKLNQDGREFWGAISARPIETGKSYVFADANLMFNFESKALGRIFDSIYFIQHFADLSEIHEKQQIEDQTHIHSHNGKVSQTKKISKVKPVKGGYAIVDIYESGKLRNGDRVTVSGEVVKINKGIMNRHWIHIQDGSGIDETGNLTLTTPRNLDFGVGDVITFSGILSYDKDFGAGYKYRVIVEDAQWERFVDL